MKRLRHPIRAITEPFGKAGLIVACLALVAAMGGTALAASKLNGTQKKEVEKIAKKYAGKPGAAGATGPGGPAGAAGKNGNDGTSGTSGTSGTNGKSVTVTAIQPETPACEERGGAEVKQEGAGAGTEVCNGAEGSPWTAGGTLPSGKTETGAYSFLAGPNKRFAITISFPIPLRQAIPASEVHLVTSRDQEEVEGQTIPSGCSGTAAEPEAEPGNLCIFEQLGGEAFNQGGNPLVLTPPLFLHPGEVALGAGTTGAVSFGGEAAHPEVSFSGTWAVTAP